MRPKYTPEELSKAFLKEIYKLGSLLETDSGKLLMNKLEQEFDSENIFVSGDPHQTSYKCGQRDVIVYVRQILKRYQEVKTNVEE